MPAARRFSRFRPFGFAAVAVAVIAAASAAWAYPGAMGRAWRHWRYYSGPDHPYSLGTVIRPVTERSRIEVYDVRRHPALIQSFVLADPHDLSLEYFCRPGRKYDTFTISSMGEAGKERVHLAVDSAAAGGVLVDARFRNIYEAETGGRMNPWYGWVIRARRQGCFQTQAPLRKSSPPENFTPADPSGQAAAVKPSDSADLPTPSFADPFRIVIRPDMTSPLWGYPGAERGRVALRGRNGSYYLLSSHQTLGSAAARKANMARNPGDD